LASRKSSVDRGWAIALGTIAVALFIPGAIALTAVAAPNPDAEATSDPPLEPAIDSRPVPTLAELTAALDRQQWQQASDLTWAMLGREVAATDGRAFRRFPCGELREIVQAWRQASGDRQGPAVQFRQWAALAARHPQRSETEQAFRRFVGWDRDWQEVTGDRPLGHYPSEAAWETGNVLTFGCGDAECRIPRTVVEETQPALYELFPRLNQCRIF
jgi:hypothetical protein